MRGERERKFTWILLCTLLCNSLYSILSRWKAEGWIEKADKNNWTKTQTLQPCNLA